MHISHRNIKNHHTVLEHQNLISKCHFLLCREINLLLFVENNNCSNYSKTNQINLKLAGEVKNDEKSLYHVAISSTTLKFHISPWSFRDHKSSCSWYPLAHAQKLIAKMKKFLSPDSNDISHFTFWTKITPLRVFWKSGSPGRIEQ